ncbi:MAG TPA: hypothetical protein VIO81_00515 [Methyloversatilis sp.]
MSLLSSDPLLLDIGPHGLALSRHGERLHAYAQPLPADGLLPVLDALPAALTPRRSALTVNVDNAWVRWQVVDMPPGVSGTDEQRALVRARMIEVFGTTAQGWTFAWDERPAARVLACAMDAALPQVLTTWCAARGLRLVSLQPAWLRAYTAFRGSAPLGGFAQLSRGWLCMGLWSGDGWLHMRGEALDDPAALGTVLERRLSLFDGALDGGQLFVQGAPAVSLPHGWRCVVSGVSA